MPGFGIKKYSSDLELVAGLVILTDIFVLVPPLSSSFIRMALGLGFVLFLPGYALIAAIFPAKKDLDRIERIVLSFGMDIAVVPLLGLTLNYTRWGIREIPIFLSLSVFILSMCSVACLRRSRLPETEVFTVSFKTLIQTLKTEAIKKPESKASLFFTALLILSILASLAVLFYDTNSAPKEGETFTEFYILGPEGMATNYPTNYVLGENGTVILGIINHEHMPVNYSLEVRLENVSLLLPENLRSVNLENNMTWEEPLIVTPPFKGRGMNLEFLLFNENEGKTPYRSLQLWINVNETAGET